MDRLAAANAIADDVGIVRCQLAHLGSRRRPASMQEILQAASGGEKISREVGRGARIELFDVDSDDVQSSQRRVRSDNPVHYTNRLGL